MVNSRYKESFEENDVSLCFSIFRTENCLRDGIYMGVWIINVIFSFADLKGNDVPIRNCVNVEL